MLLKVLTSSYIFAIPPTAFLFFLRVRAVYPRNRLVISAFGLLWLGVFGSSFVVPLKVAEGIHIGTTNQCILTQVSRIAVAPVAANMALNLLVFVAVPWRLAVIHQSTKSRFWRFFKGEGMSPMSSMVIKSGQLYYLYVLVVSGAQDPSLTQLFRVTLGFNIVVVIMFVAPGVPPVLRAILTVPHLALENSMATRVFRMLKFDAHASALHTMPQTSGSRRPGGHTLRSHDDAGHGHGHGMIIFRSKPDIAVDVDVSTHVHIEDDVCAKEAELSV
jgi:hypothetical protein